MMTNAEFKATWQRLNAMATAASHGYKTAPLTVLAAADALLAGAEVRYVDTAVETTDDKSTWRLLAFTDQEVIEVIATASDTLWSYEKPDPTNERKLNPVVSATCWPLRRVRAVTVDASPSTWLGTQLTVPAPPIRIQIDGADHDLVIPLNPEYSEVHERLDAVRQVIGLIRTSREAACSLTRED